ncbi:MAG: tyrosine--tRNA ligase [Pseudomonadota bacterium]
MSADILADLEARGLLTQSTDRAALAAHLADGARTLYCGFDPSADSLHVGNLVPLLALRRFQLAGHRPILLLGGATGLIGDPSGKSEERQLNSTELVASYVDSIGAQARRFLDFEGPQAAHVVNNLDWTGGRSVIEFLRDIGKHFSVNAMIQRDSVRLRLEREGQGISYTEFSYMLLQAMDFLELAKTDACTLQIGGSDQWGNMVSGADLIRRTLQREAHVLTMPLITRADGTKFGKSAAGAVWLDPARTSPYSFHQFWLNVADEDVIRFLRYFTFVELDEVAALETELAADPAARKAQQRLAAAVTDLVHGSEARTGAERIAQALFSGSLDELTEADLAALAQDGMEKTAIEAESVGLLEAMVRSGLAASNGAARKLVQSGGVSINGVKQADPTRQLDWSDARFGRYFLLRRGKKQWHLMLRETGSAASKTG